MASLVGKSDAAEWAEGGERERCIEIQMIDR